MTLPTAGTWRFHPLDRPCPLPQTASFLLPSKYRATHTSPRSPGRRQIPAPTQCTLYPLVGSCGRPHPYSQPYYPDAGEKCRGSQTDNHKYQSVENLSMPAFCFALRSKRRVLSRFKAILFPDFSEVAGCGLHCAHRATAVLSWGPCEHRDHTSYLALPLLCSTLLSFKGGLVDPRLRASNEHQATLLILLRPRVARPQGIHRAIPPPAGGLSLQLAKKELIERILGRRRSCCSKSLKSASGASR